MGLINDIADCMKRPFYAIYDVMPMNAGMTNDSYTFTYLNEKYIYRVPGKGSNGLVNRVQEYHAYEAIKPLHISDDVVYYDMASGKKITKFINNAHTCDPYDFDEVAKCLLFVKHKLHESGVISKSSIDIEAMINKYETLMGTSKYLDYERIKKKIFTKLRRYHNKWQYCMCHFDLNPDNFLLTDNNIILLDWEYAGMNDPMFDLAGWIVYKDYTHEQVMQLAQIYFERPLTHSLKKKLFTCIAAMGLLWSNWCEYKRLCGEEFGDYAEQQYRYAKIYSNK